MVCSGWDCSCCFLKLGTSILSASLTLAIMTLAVHHISTTEEAMRVVPERFRVVCASLGANKWQGIRKIILPEAMPGILTGVILGLERAAGETAPILFTGATFFYRIYQPRRWMPPWRFPITSS
jgi:phosphate transport system permease protein